MSQGEGRHVAEQEGTGVSLHLVSEFICLKKLLHLGLVQAYLHEDGSEGLHL